MVNRMLVAAVMVLAGLGVVPAATAEAPPPAASTYDQAVTEPPPGAPGVPVDIVVSLDRPADHEVTVFYQTRVSYTRDWPAGGLTFTPGETEHTVSFTVTHDSSGSDGFIVLDITGAIGATVARSKSVVTIDNIDRAGSFSCSGLAERLVFYSLPNEGGYDAKYGQLGSSPCRDEQVRADGYSYTTPGGKGVKPVTITVTPVVVASHGEPLPSPGYYGPFVGDGANARAVGYDVLISEPGGKRIQVEGMWGEVSTHCRALGGEPDLLTNGGVGGIIVNGKRSKDLPDLVMLNSGGVMFQSVRRWSGTPAYPYGGIERTLLRVNFPGGYLQLGQISVLWSGRPCST